MRSKIKLEIYWWCIKLNSHLIVLCRKTITSNLTHHDGYFKIKAIYRFMFPLNIWRYLCFIYLKLSKRFMRWNLVRKNKNKLRDKKTKNYVEKRLKCEINQLLLMSKDSGKREAHFLFQAQIHTHRWSSQRCGYGVYHPQQS